MSGKVSGHFVSLSVTPTISTSAYAVDDQLGSVQTLSFGSADKSLVTMLSISVLDKAKQGAPITIFFFNALPTITSSDNAALDISDAEMDKCVGHKNITGNDYVTTQSNSIATVGLNSAISLRSSTANALYAVVKSNGTPTYASTSDLKFIYTMGLDH